MARRTSPVPLVDAPNGSRSTGASRDRPEAPATSPQARPPHAQAADAAGSVISGLWRPGGAGERGPRGVGGRAGEAGGRAGEAGGRGGGTSHRRGARGPGGGAPPGGG